MGQFVKLEWKIGENEEVNYVTVMSPSGNSNISMNDEKIADPYRDSSENHISKEKEMLEEFDQVMNNTAMISKLTNNGSGIIDVVITTSPNGKPCNGEMEKEDSLGNEMQQIAWQMNKGVILRGSVYATGGIHSFWVTNNQKGIISTFFELPQYPVKIGDTWKLDINFLEIDQSFRCDSSYHINEVTLTDIRKINGETIASLKYNIIEYVEGTMNFPVFINENNEQKAKRYYSFNAVAEFSVDRGRWVSYEGVSSFDQDDIMTFNYKLRHALISK